MLLHLEIRLGSQEHAARSKVRLNAVGAFESGDGCAARARPDANAAVNGNAWVALIHEVQIAA